VGNRSPAQKFALRLIILYSFGTMPDRDGAFREIVNPGEIGSSRCDRHHTSAEVRFEHGTHGSTPCSRDARIDTFRQWEVGCGERASRTHLLHHSGNIFHVLFQEFLNPSWAYAMRFPTVAEHWPQFHGHDGSLVRPLLGELVTAVNDVVE
jgi:hypothetical protein